MKRWKGLITSLLITLSVFPQGLGLAQPAGDISLAGEWQLQSTSTGAGWVVVIEQKGMGLQGSWKESYKDRDITCRGLYFEGKVSGNRVIGSRTLCGGRMQPLNMTIVDADTLEYPAFAYGGTGQTVTLKRIK